MSEENSSTDTAAIQGSDYERSADQRTTVKKAKDQYRRGIQPIPADHPVAAYLRKRGLWPLQPLESEILRAQFYAEDDFDGFWLAAPLLDGEGNIVAVQRASINKDGDKVSVGERNDRITIGEAYEAAIRLVPVVHTGVLCVAEGLEDAMSVARLVDGSVCWAACGRRGMEQLAVPPMAKAVHIYADHDPAGLESAMVLAMRMVLAGKQVRIFASVVPGEDPNDVLLNKHEFGEPLKGWLGRIETFHLWHALSPGEVEHRLKALAKAENLTVSAIKSEWKAFVAASRPRRVLVATGMEDSLDKAVQAGYRYSREGIKPGDIVNAMIALQRIGLTARLDVCDMKLYLEALHPQSPVAAIPGAPMHGLGEAVELRDELVSPLLGFIAMRENVTFSPMMLHQAIAAIAHSRRHHSMQDWLAKHPPWDGTARIESVLFDTFGIEDTPLHRWSSAALFVGQALRILSPGAKVDVMPVLVGTSGWRKSSFVRAIAAGGPERFTDARLDATDPRQVLEQTLGKTVVEWSEMEGATKAEWEPLKAFLSRTEDSGRLAYGRVNTSMPRGFINVGTVNNADFLRSQVGSRRFLPMVVQKPGEFDRFGPQIWAEARAKAQQIIEEAQGRRPELAVPSELWPAMEAALAGHVRHSIYAQVLAPFFDEFPEAVVRSRDVQQFLVAHNKPCADRELGEALKALGFTRGENAFEFRSVDNGAKWRGWYRGDRPLTGDIRRRLLGLTHSSQVGKTIFVEDFSRDSKDKAAQAASDAEAMAMVAEARAMAAVQAASDAAAMGGQKAVLRQVSPPAPSVANGATAPRRTTQSPRVVRRTRGAI
jgi:hypothetical protein